MARSEKEEDILIEENTISFMVYIKGFFLIGLIIFGMLVVTNSAKKSEANQRTQETKSVTLKAIRNIKTQTQHYVAQNIKKEGVIKGLEKTSNQVLGEATQAANIAVTKTTDTVSDFIYEHTLEIVINNLIEKLPDRQKNLFIDRFCEKNQCE